MRNGIVIAGNVFVDIKGFPHDNYIPAGRNAGDVEIVHGGVGRNVAEDIANLELRPTFVSMVDDNGQGEAAYIAGAAGASEPRLAGILLLCIM